MKIYCQYCIIIFLLITGFSETYANIANQKEANASTATIKVKVTGYKERLMIMVKKLHLPNVMSATTVDSITTDEKDEYYLKLTNLEPGYYQILFKSKTVGTSAILLIDADQQYSFDVRLDTATVTPENGQPYFINKIRITGSKDNDLMKRYFDISSSYYMGKIFPLEKRIREASKQVDNGNTLDSMNSLLKSYRTNMNRDLMKFLLDSMGTSIGIFQTMSTWDNTEIDFMRTVMERFRKDAPNSFVVPLMEQKYSSLVATSLLNNKAPDFTIKDINGQSIRLSDYIGKKRILVDFWASWCGPCISEMTDFKNAYQVLQQKDLVIISVSVDDKMDLWEKTAKKLDLPWVSGLSEKGKNTAPVLYGIHQLPANFLIDKEGIVRKKNMTLFDLLNEK